MVHKPIIACYKAYRGGEWFRASLEAIAPFIDGITVALSQRPWELSVARSENCSEVLAAFQKAHPALPVFIDHVDFRRHEHHQVYCLQMVLAHFGPNVSVLTPDTDEVWDVEGLRILCETMRSRFAGCYLVALWDYVRSPFWRVLNNAGASFIAGLGSPLPLLPFRTTRRPRRENRLSVPGIRCHHFPFVREDESEIIDKMRLCEQQDGAYHPDWLETIWPRLPSGKNLHPAVRFEHVWPHVDVIGMKDLPAILHSVPRTRAILERYAPKGRIYR